jgi:hypothetical protein
MAVGTRRDLSDIIAGGRRAAETIRNFQTQPRRATSRAGSVARTARQQALEDRGSITKPFTDALASMRAQGSGVRSTGATSLTPKPPRQWSGSKSSSPDQRRREAGQTRTGYVDDQEGMYHLAQARNQQAQQAQDAPFNAWAEQQGFGGDHPIALGQYEDGNYAGFRTQGLMTAAVKGRGDALMNDGAAQAADVRGMADELERSSDYLKRRELAGMGDELDTMGADLPQLDALDSAFAAFGGDDLNLGSEFARAVDLTPDQLISYIDSPEYDTYNQQILNSGGDEFELAQIVQELSMTNPPLLRILETQYGDLSS